MGVELAVVVFGHDDGADSAFGAARGRHPDAAWAREVALLVHHRNDRITLNGTVLGHYVSVDEQDHVSQPGVAVGGIVGGLLGLALGPPATAAGIVAGGALGAKLGTANEVEYEPDLLMEDLRAAVPKGSSAIVLIAEVARGDEMLAALGDVRGSVARRALAVEELAAIEEAIRSTPPASSGPRTEGDAPEA